MSCSRPEPAKKKEEYISFPVVPAVIGDAMRTMNKLLAEGLKHEDRLDVELPNEALGEFVKNHLTSLTGGDPANPPWEGSTSVPVENPGAAAQVRPQQPAVVPLHKLPVGSIAAPKSLYATSDAAAQYGLDWGALKPFVFGNYVKHPPPIEPTRLPFSVVLGYHTQADGTWRLEHLWINNQDLADALANIFAGYPGIDFKCASPCISHNFAPFYHRRVELWKALVLEPRSEVRQNLLVVLEVIEHKMTQVADTIHRIETMGSITFEDLETVCAPSEQMLHINPETGVQVVGQLSKLERVPTPQGRPKYRFTLLHCDWDGNKSGCRKEYYELDYFDGQKPLLRMPILPLRLHPSRTNVAQALIARGRKFERLRSIGFQHYDGYGTSESYDPTQEWSFKQSTDPQKVDERVVLDQVLFYKRDGSCKPELLPLDLLSSRSATESTISRSNVPRRTAEESMAFARFKTDEENSRSKHPDLTPWTRQQCLMSMPYTHGYSISSKKWFKLWINQIEEFGWRKNTIADLVLEDQEKRILCSYIPGLNVDRYSRDAPVPDSKVTILLCGPTGSGKRAIAEAVAEKLHRPLFVINNSDLRGSVQDIERLFTTTIDFCRRWKAVLLLEDAERFLRMEPTLEKDQNTLFAAFESLLMQYDGIAMISAKPGFQVPDSIAECIDVQMGLPSLNDAGRAKVWSNLLRGERVTDSQISWLAQIELNGREIKKVIKTARVVATAECVTIDVKHIQTAINTEFRFKMVSRGSHHRHLHTTPQTTPPESELDSDWTLAEREDAFPVAPTDQGTILGAVDADAIETRGFYYQGKFVDRDAVGNRDIVDTFKVVTMD